MKKKVNVNEFAASGFRSPGVARADTEGKWQFVAQAKATIASARQMGVSIYYILK